MTRRFTHPAVSVLVALISIASTANAQSLASRIASASERSVQFSFKARPGVCGDGRSYYSNAPGNYNGTFNSSSAEQCVAGPVRVVVDLADRNVVAMRTFVGAPAAPDAGVRDLGTVAPADAADYLLTVAARGDGRVGRDAISAALLGDSVDATNRLLDIARDQARPLETRRASISGLRFDARQADRVAPALLQMATNENEVQGVRSYALSVLSRLDHSVGIQSLIQLANANPTSWTGRESLRVLASSGDPRARQFLRTTAQRTDLPDEVQAVAIRGLGRNYVTGQDANLLRSLYPRLTGDRSRDAVLASISELGGTENLQWLMGIVRDDKLSEQSRRRALESAARAGASSSSLVALYDPTTDPQLRSSLITIYSRLSDKAATDKLVWIARNEQNQQLRRRAVQALSRTSDPAIRQVLQDIVER